MDRIANLLRTGGCGCDIKSGAVTAFCHHVAEDVLRKRGTADVPMTNKKYFDVILILLIHIPFPHSFLIVKVYYNIILGTSVCFLFFYLQSFYYLV